MKQAMYRGKLPIAGVELNCAVLEDEARVLSMKSIFEAFERPSRGNGENDKIHTENGVITLPPFIASKTLYSLMESDFLEVINSIEYIDGSQKFKGYSAEILPMMCNLYLEARRKTLLTPAQDSLAEKSEIMLTAFAKVGIIALIDETTGFQCNRKKDALRLLVEQYIAEGVQKWLKRFPDKFFEELDRLYGNEKTTSRKGQCIMGGLLINIFMNQLKMAWQRK